MGDIVKDIEVWMAVHPIQSLCIVLAILVGIGFVAGVIWTTNVFYDDYAHMLQRASITGFPLSFNEHYYLVQETNLSQPFNLSNIILPE